MAYFPDLAPCTYYNDPEPDPEDGGATFPPLLAVGWLDARHPFPVGDPGKEVFLRLKAFRDMRWLPVLFMGGHTCELCRYDGPYSHKDLFIPGDGVTYAVPEGIVHYVACHGYLPPQEFREALIRAPFPDTPEFFAAMRSNGWQDDVARPEEDLPWWHGPHLALDKAMSVQGQAWCAALEALFVTRGRYPEKLEEAQRLTRDVSWSYAAEPENGYRLLGQWDIDGMRLTFDSKVDMPWILE